MLIFRPAGPIGVQDVKFELAIRGGIPGFVLKQQKPYIPNNCHFKQTQNNPDYKKYVKNWADNALMNHWCLEVRYVF